MPRSLREDALDWLYGLEPRGIRLGLHAMRDVLARRGHPERGLRVVHVAGTNGKGSVSAMLERTLRAAGYRTGLYTSPHLHRFGERIRVSGRPMTDAAIARGVRAIRDAAAELSFFEATTLLAFEHFARARPDVVVLEVGLGGRLDATNVVEAPLLTVITSVGRDHEAFLGDSIAAIAAEKAGILKDGVPAVVGARDEAARAVILARARALHVSVALIGRDFEVDPRRRLALAGEHQRDNAAVVVAAVDVLREAGFRISRRAVETGLTRVRWPGRLERLRRRPDVVVDAAHNADGAAALARYLAAHRRRGPRALVFGAMRDKDLPAMLGALVPHVDDVYFAAPKTARAATPAELAGLARGLPARSVRDAVGRAIRRVGPDGLVVVTGSIFTLAEARAAILGLAPERVIPL